MPKNLQTRYRRLQRQVSRIGWIATGSAFRRYFTICSNGKTKRCGPYYSLTRKQGGQTITHALTHEQYDFFSRAITNHRTMDAILKEMRKLTVRFIYTATQSVSRRKRIKLTRKQPEKSLS